MGCLADVRSCFGVRSVSRWVVGPEVASQYDESAVPPIAPPIRSFVAITPVTDEAAWKTRRRPEILALFKNTYTVGSGEARSSDV